MLNGLGYMLFGVPSRDLETTWYDVTQISVQPTKGQSPLLNERAIATITTVSIILSMKTFETLYLKLI